jgi:xanthosine utilization system XapX-like protein
MEIKIRLPRIPAGGLANIVGLVGLIAVVLAIGGLLHNWWWSVLSGGVFAVALAYVAQTHVEAERAAGRPTVVAEATRAA